MKALRVFEKWAVPLCLPLKRYHGPRFVAFRPFLSLFALCLHTGVSVSAASEANGEMGTKLLLQVSRLILVYVCMVAMLVQVVTFRIILTSYYLFLHLFFDSITLL